MLGAKILREKISESGKSFFAVRLIMSNAEIILLSEREDNLGTLVAAVPKRRELIGPPLSSVLLGDRNIILSRMLAEKFADSIEF